MKQYVTKDAMIAMGILAVMVVCAVTVVYLPQSRALRQVKADIAAQKAQLQEDARKASVVPQMLRDVEAMKKRYNDRWEKRLPPRKELGGFLKEIGQNLHDEALSGRLIQPGNPEREELFHTLPIEMKFRGSFQAMCNFLDRIDKMERLTRIHKLGIVTDASTAPAELDVSLRMNIYFTDTQG